MAERKRLEVDPVTGQTTDFYYDGTEHRVHIHAAVDVEPLIERNKAEFNLHNDSPGHFGGEMHRVASIPWAVFAQLAKLGITTPAGRVLDQKKFKDWLNDPENRYFRTRPGRI
jgi:hypothetical protein